jgi:uncharacterized OsmC-like protein
MQAVVTSERADTLNGLPLAELHRIPVALHEAPEQGLLGYQTRTRWLGGQRSRSTVEALEVGGQRLERRYVIDADEPPLILGGDTAPTPQQLLLACIGSCLTAVYAVQATLVGIELRSLEVELRGTLDVRGLLGLAEVPPGFREVDVRVFVDAAASPEQIRVLHARALALTPNIYHLMSAIPARTQLVIEG